MTDLQILELAIRRAASQMPNHQSRAFRLVADELAKPTQPPSMSVLNIYRNEQTNLD